ncbi:hypothetical protein Hanom_Chr07g00597151 [Helianthus anomalus]
MIIEKWNEWYQSSLARLHWTTVSSLVACDGIDTFLFTHVLRGLASQNCPPPTHTFYIPRSRERDWRRDGRDRVGCCHAFDGSDGDDMERGRRGRPNKDCNGPHKNRGWQLCREVSAKAAARRLARYLNFLPEVLPELLAKHAASLARLTILFQTF